VPLDALTGFGQLFSYKGNMDITPADVQAKRSESIAAGAFFEVEDIELDGYTYKAFKHAPKTTIDVIQNARAHGDIDFIVYNEERFSYNRFYALVDALAASLQHDYSISKGDRVAIAMRNNPQWLVSYAAATLIGAIVVPINSWGKSEELQYALSDSGSILLICDPTRYQLLENVDLDIRLIIAAMPAATDSPPGVARFEDVLAAGEGKSYEVAAARPEDHCVILYTSGSTGFPKGVVHRHIAMTQSLFNMMWLGFLVMSLEGPREFRGGAERETPLLTVPLFHCTGLLAGFYMPLSTGQKVVMMYKWDSVQALELIQREKVTGLTSVPAIVQDLLNHPQFDQYDTSSLIRVSAAGAATPTGLPELIQEKTGNPSRSAGYGMTETVAAGSTMSGVIFDLKPESSGIVSPIMEIRSVDAAGKVLPPGQAGEIELYGICCTPGYWEKPEANQQTFVDGRWLKTGDLGMVDDDGFVHITGRIKEIVIRGGENIYPGEIERAAFEIENVHEVSVFGEPDTAMGEELVMVIYPRPGTRLQECDVRDFLKQRLAGYKVPRTIVFSDKPLPRNASEKLHKLKVREHYLQGKATA
jgi:long-chain acyl-CoA synthetase